MSPPPKKAYILRIDRIPLTLSDNKKPLTMHIRLRIIFLLLSVCCVSSLWAQNDTIRISFKIEDSFTRIDIDSVSVMVYESDSTTLLSSKIKSYAIKTHTAGKRTLYYHGYIPRRATYVVKFSREGYNDQWIKIDLPKKKFGIKVTDWTYPKTIIMRKSYNAFDTNLGEATVTASRVVMVVKGDTVEYDARAFRLAEGSMLDNLMSMLPGVTLSSDGKIYHNGKYVEKLMINGRDFFKGNPKIALDNLPAYVVDKIQFYHEAPDWEYLTGKDTMSVNQKAYVVDVKLKREYNQSWIANFELAGGSKLHGGWDEVYLARVFGMRITDHSAIGAFANINNLSDDHSPGRKGEWAKLSPSKGEQKVKKGGLNFNIDGKRKNISYDTSIEATHQDSKLETTTNSVKTIGSLKQKDVSKDITRLEKTELEWKNTIKIPTKNVFFLISPALYYTHERGNNAYDRTQQSASALVEDAGTTWEDEYSRAQSSLSKGDTWRTLTKFGSEVKSPFSGKIYSIYAFFDYSHKQSKSYRNDLIRYADRSTLQDNRDVTPSESYSYSVSIDRTIFSKTILKWWWRLNMSYAYEQTYGYGARTRETDSVSTYETAVTPSLRGDWKTDWENTYHSVSMDRTHTLFSTLESSYKDFNTYTNFTLEYQNRKMSDVRNQVKNAGKDKAVKIDYNTRLSYTPWRLSLTYSYVKELPEMEYLLNVRDAADPLYISMGNPNLRSPRKHTISVSKRLWNKKHQRNFYVSAEYSKQKDAIGMYRSYDSETKVTTTAPRNINGNWSASLSSNYSQALNKKKTLTLSSNTDFSLYHSVDYSYASSTEVSERSVVDNYSLRETLDLRYRTLKGINIGGKASVSYSNQKARTLSAFSNHSVEFSYGLTFTMPVTEHFGLESDIMAYARRGYTSKDMNTTEWVWNAGASYTFGKNKEWLIRAVGFDLLHQLSSTRRVLNEQGYTETRYNTLPAYATLHLIYRLNKAPKKK